MNVNRRLCVGDIQPALTGSSLRRTLGWARHLHTCILAYCQTCILEHLHIYLNLRNTPEHIYMYLWAQLHNCMHTAKLTKCLEVLFKRAGCKKELLYPTVLFGLAHLDERGHLQQYQLWNLMKNQYCQMRTLSYLYTSAVALELEHKYIFTAGRSLVLYKRIKRVTDINLLRS